MHRQEIADGSEGAWNDENETTSTLQQKRQEKRLSSSDFAVVAHTDDTTQELQESHAEVYYSAAKRSKGLEKNSQINRIGDHDFGYRPWHSRCLNDKADELSFDYVENKLGEVESALSSGKLSVSCQKERTESLLEELSLNKNRSPTKYLV